MQHATTSDVLRVYWRGAMKFKGRAFLILFAVTFATVADTLQPWFLKALFDLLETYAPTTATITLFIPVLVGMALIRLAGWFGWRTVGITSNRFQPNVFAALDENSFKYILGHSYQFFADQFGGSLIQKIKRLSRGFERMADEVEFQIVPTSVVLVGATIGLYIQYPLLAILFVAWTVLFILFNYWASQWAVKTDIRRAELDSEATGVLADAITNAVTIKLFPAPGEEEARFGKVNQAFRESQKNSWDRHEIIFAAQGLLMIAIDVGLMYVGVRYWLEGFLTLGDLAFIQSSLVLVFNKLWTVGRSFRHIFDSIADGKEMVELLMEPHGIRDKKGAKPLDVTKGKIEFKDVTFCFHRTRCVLEDFNLSIKPREKIALVGPSGAGKTTITKLLFRFYDLDEGKILVDGQDISKATQDSLRDQISLVPQEPILFHRTLMENIRYGRIDATDEEVFEAARKARCDRFIADLPLGYDTYVGERGIKLSGGERQRVAITRAIVKNAPILVLDEATSSLDSESERLIQDALHELMQDKTVIVVAHRLSTIMEMDRILVIEGGTIAAQGTHKELLKKKGTYRKLWDIQAGGFAE